MLAELNYDLNTAKALALMWEVLKSSLRDAVQKATLRWLDQALGLGLDSWEPPVHTISEPVLQLIAARDLARAEKRWGEADVLRAAIEAEGYIVRDTPAGTVAEPR